MSFGNSVVGGIALVRPAIRSPNYVAGVSGWTINIDGTAEFANATVRGEVLVGPAAPSPHIQIVSGTGLPSTLTGAWPTDFRWDSAIIWWLNSTDYFFQAVGQWLSGPGTPGVTARGRYTTTAGLFFETFVTTTGAVLATQYGSVSFNPGRMDMNMVNTSMVFDSSSAFTLDVPLDFLNTAGGVNMGGTPVYLLRERKIYTTADSPVTFSKASFGGFRAALITCAGGGGAGGGCASTAAGNSSAGAGGASGGVVQQLIIESDLDTNETITIGSGGTGNSNAAGNGGGDTTFTTNLGTLTGGGGPGGAAMATGTVYTVTAYTVGGSASGVTGVPLVLAGGPGMPGFRITGVSAMCGTGGTTPLGLGTPGMTSAPSGNGTSGAGYGAGGSGAISSANANNRSGGAGAPGVCIVDILV